MGLPLASGLDSHRARHNRPARRCYRPPPRLHVYDPRRASSRRHWRLGVSRVLCDQQLRQDHSFSSTSPGGFNEGAAGSRGHGGDRPSWRGGSSGYYHASGCLIVRTELRARCRLIFEKIECLAACHWLAGAIIYWSWTRLRTKRSCKGRMSVLFEMIQAEYYLFSVHIRLYSSFHWSKQFIVILTFFV